MEYGYCIKSCPDAWQVRFLRDGVETDYRRYRFEDEVSQLRAYEQAMLDGHMFVTEHVLLMPFPQSRDLLIEQATAGLNLQEN